LLPRQQLEHLNPSVPQDVLQWYWREGTQSRTPSQMRGLVVREALFYWATWQEEAARCSDEGLGRDET